MGATIIYVTHDQIEAMTMATRVGVIEQGHLVQVDSPRADLRRPGQCPCRRAAGPAGDQSLAAEHVSRYGSPGGGAYHRGAHRASEDIQEPERFTAKGKVSWIEHLGDRNHLHVRIADTEVVTLADPDSGLHVGDDVAIEIVRPLYFDVSGNRVNA